MVEHTLWTVHESLVQGYCATADCATVDCARLRDKRYYCTTGKEKNTTNCAHNRTELLSATMALIYCVTIISLVSLFFFSLYNICVERTV